MKNIVETVIELDRTSLPARRAMKVTRTQSKCWVTTSAFISHSDLLSALIIQVYIN